MQSHKDAVRATQDEHEKDLEALERRVKIEVGMKDQKIREIDEVIGGQAVRCDHAKKMIENYRQRKRVKDSGGGSPGARKLF